MKALFCVRYNFPKNCVVCNPGDPKHQFLTSIADFYFNTLEEATSHCIADNEVCSAYSGAPIEIIRLKGISTYTKAIYIKTGAFKRISRENLASNQ